MKAFKLILLFLVAGLTNGISQATWTFDDAHSNLQFSLVHLMVAEIEGSVQIKEATLKSLKNDLSDASIFILADMKTIDTDNDGRDEHLRSADFFDVARYPDLTFISTSFKKLTDNKYTVTGNLTFHGITRNVTMEVIATEAIRPYDSKTVLGFKATGTIKRTEFNISSDTPSAMLSDEVQIKGNVIFVRE